MNDTTRLRDDTTRPVLTTATRTCLFCGGEARVRVPSGSDDIDIEAEFAGAGRSFSDFEDGDPIGVGCYRCSRKAWAVSAGSDGEDRPDD